jgi:hypothetical protein
MESLLSVEQLAVVLHKSPASIRSDASRKPSSLPPICRLPGTKRLLWRKQDVDTWVAEFIVSGSGKNEDFFTSKSGHVDLAPVKRGRPTKADQVARARQRPSGPMQPHDARH